MPSAGIKDLKNNLSKDLYRIKKREDLLITERGKIIARIIPENNRKMEFLETLRPLIKEGLVKMPSRKLNKDIPSPAVVPGKPISEIALETRR
jgi:antitoxin (DNA-binding transcriptional repressor) of toxin-antitoxin stability system